MKVKEIKTMLIEQLSKMWENNSYVAGIIAGGLSFAIPEWIFINQDWTVNHTVTVLILIGFLILDQITGRRLAKQSDIVRKTSSTMIESVFRNFSMLLLVALAYGIDWIIGSGSICFVFAAASLSYHTFYSFLANAIVLGWGKNLPIWLFKWLSDEIKVKAQKYFKDAEIITELDKKLENKKE
ncbi:phage holin family protein [Vagococcus carniphilus]|uniref:phage holin family protein n=1 Tax=Vagococcus carniphilus TaxID=218144 RepID=UPI002890651E|nr:phage holin family protein [Vagococcus carniphilus]MDT2850185.1 phage holin family protein [Vagococcus carniphilus]